MHLPTVNETTEVLGSTKADFTVFITGYSLKKKHEILNYTNRWLGMITAREIMDTWLLFWDCWKIVKLSFKSSKYSVMEMFFTTA